MRIYMGIEEMESDKKIYASIALTSKVRVEYDYKGIKYLLLPYSVGDLTVLIEINDEKEIIDSLLESYIHNLVLERYLYPEEIRNLVPHFKTELKKFRILVVKYNSAEEKEFSRYSLSNITFGVVNFNNTDIHLIPSGTEVKAKEGYSLSSIVETPEEGLRQALLVSRWFGGGNYEELPKLAMQKDLDLKEWEKFLNYFLFSKIDEKYFSVVIKKLNEFRKTTYFDPVKNIEKIALGIVLAKSHTNLGELEEFI